jgi:hypothetical protein
MKNFCQEPQSCTQRLFQNIKVKQFLMPVCTVFIVKLCVLVLPWLRTFGAKLPLPNTFHGEWFATGTTCVRLHSLYTKKRKVNWTNSIRNVKVSVFLRVLNISSPKSCSFMTILWIYNPEWSHLLILTNLQIKPESEKEENTTGETRVFYRNIQVNILYHTRFRAEIAQSV